MSLILGKVFNIGTYFLTRLLQNY